MVNARALLSETKFYESYSRYREDKGRPETWSEAVERVMDMHKRFYEEKLSPELLELMDEAQRAYNEKLVLGSQRALQFGGDQLLAHNLRTYNCMASYADRAAFFGEYFYALLCGCGVGFSVQHHHIASVPKIIARDKASKIFEVPDSIEGWAEAVDVLMSSFFEDGGKHPEYRGRRVYFDLSKIRPKGAKISGGFTAPGPEPLRRALDRIEYLLQGLVIRAKEAKLRAIHIYDICMHISDAVLAGGVRRSATLCIFSPDDQEMLTAKTGNWFDENPQRARSNNSALLLRGETTFEEFQAIMQHVKEFGEPGFIFAETRDACFNPCVEVGMYCYYDDPITHKRETGFQGCVSYETKLLTASGIETIGKVCDEAREIEIWNGKKWSTVRPIQTGSNRELFRVFFGDGSYLDCTDNHRLKIKHRFEKHYRELSVSDLAEELTKTKYVLSIPRSNIVYSGGKKEDYAYEYGFVLGDGTVHNGEVFATVYKNAPNKFSLISQNKFRGIRASAKFNDRDGDFVRVIFDDLDFDFSYKLKYEKELPSEIFAWDRSSILDFVAGWFDADGTVCNGGKCFRIYGSETKVRSLQLLLTKIGINSSVNLMSSKGSKTNMGIRNHDIWYIQVSTIPTDFKPKRSEVSLEYREAARCKGKFQTIKRIDKLPGLHNSYCFEEAEEHMGVFNNVLTMQCNLTEINGGLCKSKEDFFRACRASAIFGTLQAGYTDFKFMTPVTKKLFERESLLGCSVTGWMNSPEVLYDEETLHQGVAIIKAMNERVAALIGINPAARLTCVKPSGNASVQLGVASGIDGEHARRYFRNVQLNKGSDVAQIIQRTNPYMVEESLWSAGKDDYVISFPITVDSNAIFKKDLYGVKLLERVKFIQEHWVNEGTVLDRCVDKTIRHNVSNTISVDNWEVVTDYVFGQRDYFAGISFLPLSGDKLYAQAPFTEVLTEHELVRKYGPAAIFASGLIVEGLKLFDNLWTAISSVENGFETGERDDHLSNLRSEWVRRFRNFAKNYFHGDLTTTGFCLKDISLLHKWKKIEHNLVEVDWPVELSSSKPPKEIDISTLGAIACSGGVCSIQF